MYIFLGFVYEKDTKTYSCNADEDIILEEFAEQREKTMHKILKHNEVWDGGCK